MPTVGTCIGCGEIGALISWPVGLLCYTSYLEDHWPWAGGISAMNAIGTQMHDQIRLGTDPTAVDGIDMDALRLSRRSREGGEEPCP